MAPSVFLVLALGLIGLSQVRTQGYWIVLTVVAASGVSLAVDSMIDTSLPIRPISPLSAVPGLIAYALAKVFRSLIARRRLAVFQPDRAPIWIPVTFFGIGAVATTFAVTIVDSTHASVPSFLALAMLAAWMAATMLRGSILAFALGVLALIGLGLAELWSASIAVELSLSNGFRITLLPSQVISLSQAVLPAFFFCPRNTLSGGRL